MIFWYYKNFQDKNIIYFQEKGFEKIYYYDLGFEF